MLLLGSRTSDMQLAYKPVYWSYLSSDSRNIGTLGGMRIGDVYHDLAASLYIQAVCYLSPSILQS